jgi:hypothetical protein
MHAAPSVRVRIVASPLGRVLTMGLWCLSMTVAVVWLLWLSMPAWVLMLGAGVCMGFVLWAIVAQRACREPTVLRWDGQRWFNEGSGDPIPGRLQLHLDMDGCSLLSFTTDPPSARSKQWIWATPRTVRGPWRDWRAALVQSSRSPGVEPGVSTQ